VERGFNEASASVGFGQGRVLPTAICQARRHHGANSASLLCLWNASDTLRQCTDAGCCHDSARYPSLLPAVGHLRTVPPAQLMDGHAMFAKAMFAMAGPDVQLLRHVVAASLANEGGASSGRCYAKRGDLGCISPDDKNAQMFVTTMPLGNPAAAVCIALNGPPLSSDTRNPASKTRPGAGVGEGVIFNDSFPKDRHSHGGYQASSERAGSTEAGVILCWPGRDSRLCCDRCEPCPLCTADGLARPPG